jgi:hypothetical protein
MPNCNFLEQPAVDFLKPVIVAEDAGPAKRDRRYEIENDIQFKSVAVSA